MRAVGERPTDLRVFGGLMRQFSGGFAAAILLGLVWVLGIVTVPKQPVQESTPELVVTPLPMPQLSEPLPPLQPAAAPEQKTPAAAQPDEKTPIATTTAKAADGAASAAQDGKAPAFEPSATPASQAAPKPEPAPQTQPAQSTATTGRPQFVILAFDGSKSLEMWEETRAFARDEMKGRLKWTYFISCVYFLNTAIRHRYEEPARGAGSSAIGFGGTTEEVSKRVDQVNLAYKEGHEIASHACGHHEGGNKWSQEQWAQEFASFNRFVFGVFGENGIAPSAQFPEGFLFSKDKVTGFRAPFLQHSKGLWPVMNDHAYRYDTSRADAPNYWPKKINGIWNFPLANLRVAGRAARVLSMDYNFYYLHSKGKSDPDNYQTYYDEMLETYLQYFDGNYNGNRAPIHIGHHFSKWNGGAYWDALKEFARRVCGMPDVQCTTYEALADYMDKRSPDVTASLATTPNALSASAASLSRAPLPYEIDVVAAIEGRQDGRLLVKASLSGADLARLKQPRAILSGPQGPLAKVKGEDMLAQASHGAMSLSGSVDEASLNETGDVRLTLVDGERVILQGTYRVKGAALNKPLVPDEAKALIVDAAEAHQDD